MSAEPVEPYEPSRRKSGRTTTEEITKQESADALNPIPSDKNEHRETRKFKSPLLQRIRTEWTPGRDLIVQQIHRAVDKKIWDVFSEAFSVMYEIYMVVRQVEYDENEHVVMDSDGMPKWVRNPSGSYVEDWSKLTARQRERFLFLITTRMFDWDQRVQEAWVESMFAKGDYEQSFAQGFESLPPISANKPTVEDRQQRGRIQSGEDYNFTLVMTYYSRKAEALVRTLRDLAQRIKDIHTAT